MLRGRLESQERQEAQMGFVLQRCWGFWLMEFSGTTAKLILSLLKGNWRHRNDHNQRWSWWGEGGSLVHLGTCSIAAPVTHPETSTCTGLGGKGTQPPPEQLLSGSGEGGQRWGQVRSIALPIPLAQKHYMRWSKLSHATHCKSTHLLCPLPSCYSNVPSY